MDMTDPERPVTRRELREELEAVLKTVATKDDLKIFATKEDLKAYATREDLKTFATKEDLMAMRDELRTHFNVVAEDFRYQVNNLYDWSIGNASGLKARIEAVETDHGKRLLSLETRMTRAENSSR